MVDRAASMKEETLTWFKLVGLKEETLTWFKPVGLKLKAGTI